jgi:hypothetical protein
MNFDELTDENIETLLKLPKRVTNPSARWVEKPGHRQRNFKVRGDDYFFELYQRQSTFDEADYSCVLLVIKPDGQLLTLVRYNGESHKHGEIAYRCHIHKATARAIRAGKKPESFAEMTNKYTTTDGALICLTRDCNISGISDNQPDEPDLFGGSI